jgi:hypothetical protein
MAEHETAGDDKSAESAEKILGAVSHTDQTLGIAEGLGAEEAFPKLVPGLGGVVGPYGVIAGGFETAMGTSKALKGDLNGVVDAASGLSSVVGGSASTISALAGEGTIAGVSGGSAAATSSSIGSLLTTASGAISAPAVAGVAGAGGLGLAAGKLMSDAANSDLTRTGRWGTNDTTGKNLSAMEGSVEDSLVTDRAHGVKPGDWGWHGAGRSMVEGIGNAFAGTAQAGWNGLKNLGNAAVDGFGRATGMDHWDAGVRSLYGG